MLHPSASKKCGMDGVDPKRIKEIIEQCSTPEYKAYNDERQKQLQERLNRMKDDLRLLNGTAEFAARTSEADQMLFDFEHYRDLQRIVTHIDMDMYYAAVEMRDDPKLRNIPMAVGSDAMLSTSNYIARKFGVRSAMPGYIGKRLCPQLTIVRCNFDKYSKESRVFRGIFREYDPNFHTMGLDEATLDLTEFMKQRIEPAKFPGKFYGGECQCRLPSWTSELAETQPNMTTEEVTCKKCGKAQVVYNYEREFGTDVAEVVNEIRFRVEQATGLTCSAGIANNRLLAKICSEQRKPNNQFLLEADADTIKEFVKGLDVRSVPGIGPTTEFILKGLGIHKCADIIEKRATVCFAFSKRTAAFLLHSAIGVSGGEISPGESDEPSERKSVSCERSFTPTNDRKFLEQRLLNACENVIEAMTEEGFVGCSTVGIRVKYSTFKPVSKSRTSLSPITTTDAAFKIVKGLLGLLLDKDQKIRLIGVFLSGFTSDKEKFSTTMEGFVQENKPTLDDSDLVFEKHVKLPKEAPPAIDENTNVKSKKAAKSNGKNTKKAKSKKKSLPKGQMRLNFNAIPPTSKDAPRLRPHNDRMDKTVEISTDADDVVVIDDDTD